MLENELTRDEAYKNIEKYLGEPFLEDFTENTLRIRRNLLIASTITLIYKLGDLTIKNASFLGTKFDGVTPELIDLVLMILVGYLLVHFITNSWSHFWEWKLRLTGMWKAVDLSLVGDKGLGPSSEHEAPNDFTQSTLQTWFLYHIKNRGMYAAHSKSIEEKVSEFYMRALKGESENLNRDKEIKNLITVLSSRSQQENIKLNELYVRLNRFHKSFFQFQFFQLFRLFVLEWGLPIVLGLWAVCLLIKA